MTDLACVGCKFPNAASECLRGDCKMTGCDDGFWDLNGEDRDGCEYDCAITNRGDEICDHLDNDCNGIVDEGFDLLSDPANCGECENLCPTPPNSKVICLYSKCAYECLEGWFDNNGEAEDGCEDVACKITNDGVEICDGHDNDCNGIVDDDFDKTLDTSCGAYCADCVALFANAKGVCEKFECIMSECRENYWDMNKNPLDGCEYFCEITNGGVETCDGKDNDCNGMIDDGILCCPEDMVAIEGLYCMDIYEASREDADGANPGVNNEGKAVSRKGVLPWLVGGDNSLAESACNRAGKRLCAADEWEKACRGPKKLNYCYGNSYEPLTCNGIDAHCTTVPAYKGCGKDEYNFQLEPTGSYPGCTNEYGIFDINGNVWEHTANGSGLTVRGGAYNCSDSEVLHDCGYIPATWSPAALGFRCCSDGRL
ncbi:MAG: hypothetical protein Kow0090_02400 [Myxococcota bacterium]